MTVVHAYAGGFEKIRLGRHTKKVRMKTSRRVTWALLATMLALALVSAAYFAQRQNAQLSQSAATAVSQAAQIGTQLWLNILPYGQQIFEVHGDLNDPKVLYATTSRGLYKSVNAGMVWQPLYAIDASYLTLTQSGSSPNVMYLGVATGQGGGGVFKSLTRGMTWEQSGAQDIQVAVSRRVAGP